jgi:hypothetical protein
MSFSERPIARALVAFVLAATMLTAATLAVSTPAQAAKAKPPTARTYAAHSVSYASATLFGALDPRGQQAEYYFQYGPTPAYGLQTAIAEAGSGTAAVKVSVPVQGLSPLTIYHYRLVAVSAEGTTFGSDRSFKTSKVPLSLAIVASPNPVVYGGAVTIAGTLSGTGAASREIVLEGAPFPFTTFGQVGNTELTSSTGSFSFNVLGASLTSEYRVRTTTSLAVVSPVVQEGVSVIVKASHSPVKGHKHEVRVSGTVTPAETGQHIGVMRLKKGSLKLAGGAVLKPDGTNRSRFSATIYRRSSLYRILVQITSGAQASTYGAPFSVR